MNRPMCFIACLVFALGPLTGQIPEPGTPAEAAPGTPAAKPRLAVLPLKAEGRKGPQGNVSDTLNTVVTNAFTESSLFQLVERQRVDKLLNEGKFQNSGLVDESGAVELGRTLGVRYVVLGSYLTELNPTNNQTSITLSLRIVDVQTAAVQKSFLDSAEGPTLGRIVDKLTGTLAGKVRQGFATGTVTLQTVFREKKAEPLAVDLRDVYETLTSYAFLKKELETALTPRLGPGAVKVKVTLHRHLETAVFSKDRHWTEVDVALEDAATGALRGRVLVKSEVVEGTKDSVRNGEVLALIKASLTEKIRQGLMIIS